MALATAAVPVLAGDDGLEFKAEISGVNEVPPVAGVDRGQGLTGRCVDR